MSETLPEELERAEGSRHLSNLVLWELGWKQEQKESFSTKGSTWWKGWRAPGNGRWIKADEAPDPTQSVDDGLALAGENWSLVLEIAIDRLEEQTDGINPPLGRLPSFICAALLSLS